MDDGDMMEREALESVKPANCVPVGEYTAEAVTEAIEKMMKLAGFTLDGLAEIVKKLADAVSAVLGASVDSIEEVLKEIEEQCAEAQEKAEWDRRNRREIRERARFTEQRYRAEIRRLEQRRFAHRIWKPPRGGGIGTRRNRQ